ncbi:MAG TPA: HYR domain-containing protein [Kofleriaceae bacterium]|nr:HYR domain-containing protein [Kofleriaceae bacterium]
MAVMTQARAWYVAGLAALATIVMASAAPKLARARPPAVVKDLGCLANSFPRNDDNYTDLIPLGFNMQFGNELQSQLRISNNGFVLFSEQTPLWFQLRNWEAFRLPLLAVFHTDVDTRGPLSHEVTYGHITFAGRPALCVSWDGVGYFDSHDDLLDSFQLIIVDRGDLGVGDVDVIFNYDQVLWDDPPGGPPLPPRIGIFDGTQVITEFPGSNQELTVIDGGPNALTTGAGNSAIAGRYIFPLRGGIPPDTAVISGQITNVNQQPVAGATVEACLMCASGANHICEQGVSDGGGRYTLTGFPTDTTTTSCDWQVKVTPPDSFNLADQKTVQFSAPDAQLAGVDFQLRVPKFVPSGSSIGPLTGGGSNGEVPRVFWMSPLVLTTTGCASVVGRAPPVAKYIITRDGNQDPARCDVAKPKPPVPSPDPDPGLVACGAMTETPLRSGTYVANVPELAPAHGSVEVSMFLTCTNPDGPPSMGSSSFNLYIDPSGVVETTRGRPLIGATVTLLRSESPFGPFDVVPDGSAIMSPENRANPDTTDASGHFAWDTVAGYYIVRAAFPGCISPDDPSRPYVETEVLPIPPPVTDLRLRLDCGAITPPDLSVPAQVRAEAMTTAGARVVYDASATDDRDGGVPIVCAPASGAQFAVGTTTVTCSASDSSGNTATASFPVMVSYGWSDVLFPLHTDGRNRFHRNQPVPVRFALEGASARIKDLSAHLFVAAVVDGAPGPELPALPLVPFFGDAFHYQSPTRTYEFDWSTHHLPAGHYQLRIDLGDGVSHVVPIQLL